MPVFARKRDQPTFFLGETETVETFSITGETTEQHSTIVLDSTCAHSFKEREMCRNKLT